MIAETISFCYAGCMMITICNSVKIRRRTVDDHSRNLGKYFFLAAVGLHAQFLYWITLQGLILPHRGNSTLRRQLVVYCTYICSRYRITLHSFQHRFRFVCALSLTALGYVGPFAKLLNNYGVIPITSSIYLSATQFHHLWSANDELDAYSSSL